MNFLKDELKGYGPVVLLRSTFGRFACKELRQRQYFSDFDDNTSDYLAEGLMRSVIHSSRIAVKNPQDYEARSNIVWTATWALNTLIGLGNAQDWGVTR